MQRATAYSELEGVLVVLSERVCSHLVELKSKQRHSPNWWLMACSSRSCSLPGSTPRGTEGGAGKDLPRSLLPRALGDLAPKSPVELRAQSADSFLNCAVYNCSSPLDLSQCKARLSSFQHCLPDIGTSGKHSAMELLLLNTVGRFWHVLGGLSYFWSPNWITNRKQVPTKKFQEKRTL